MLTQKEYYLLTFHTTAAAMEAETYIKPYFPIAIMPVPREISSGCGLAIRFLEPDEEAIIEFLKTAPLHCTFYKMGTKKVDGKKPVYKLYEMN